MKRVIKASHQSDRLVNLLAKTDDGWKYVFKGIPESKAEAIWKAGFATGQNNFSIETDEDIRIREMNQKTLRGRE